MSQERRRDLFGQCLDQGDMAAAQDQLDRIDDEIIGEDIAHILGLRAGAADIDIDVEADALRMAAFKIIGSDGDGHHEVMDEDAVRFTALFAWRRIAARGEKTPIDLRPRGIPPPRRRAE